MCYKGQYGRGIAENDRCWCNRSCKSRIFLLYWSQLKAVIGRTVIRWLDVKIKEFYYIATCADEEKSSIETTFACFGGYADCVEGTKKMGVIYNTGVYEKGAVINTPAIKEAYEMRWRYSVIFIVG